MILHKLVVYVLGVLFFGASLFMLTGCTDEGRTRDTLYKAGYSDVKVGGMPTLSAESTITSPRSSRPKTPRGTLSVEPSAVG